VSLYRQPGRVRAGTIAAVAVVALAVGGAIGFAIGRSSAPEPTARAVVDRLRAGLRPVANGLALLPTEYPQAARGAGNESAAVQGALGRIRSALAATRADLAVLDPRGARLLDQRVSVLSASVRAKAPPSRVAQLADAAAGALAALPGGS
jgi:hypothetical protein